MLQLTKEEIIERIPERFKGKIELIDCSKAAKTVFNTKYGLPFSTYNLLQSLRNKNY